METLEFIEGYFKGELPAEDRKRFEDTVRQDPAFANEVAFYISAGMAAGEMVAEERTKRFSVLEAARNPVTGKLISMKKLWWAAAAGVILLISVYLGTGNPSLKTLAGNFVEDHYSKVDASMGASADLAQQGVAAYNKKNFKTARVKFEQVLQQNPADNKALEYAGLAALQLEEYETALTHFRKLSAISGLYENRGPFLEATTLLLRNESNDKQDAIRLLHEVVSKKLYGSGEAAEWLKTIE
jgi:tetratricopeptide (TPR) repeat protein